MNTTSMFGVGEVVLELQYLALNIIHSLMADQFKALEIILELDCVFTL